MRVRVNRVTLRNYRSIAGCGVALGDLTFLVGQNGAGKSNFLDALRFVGDSLRSSLDHALRERGGVAEVRRRSSGHPNNFSIRVDFVLASGVRGHFAFEIGAQQGGGFVVKHEQCRVGSARYRVSQGIVEEAPGPISPPASDDRLYLVTVAGLPEFRPVFDLLSSMGFYNLTPDRIRDLQPPDKGDLLARDGRNLASVLERLQKVDGGSLKTRIVEYLSRIVPGTVGVTPTHLGHLETLEFLQEVKGAEHPWRFPASNMSDGTLRGLGVLVALFQARGHGTIPLIGVEEPESALHPAAAAVLRDALREASRTAQVIVTSHSPELLDDPEIVDVEIYAVENRLGTTHILPIDEAGRTALKNHLFTAGELLRADQLNPDLTKIVDPSQLDLFGMGET